MHRNYRAKIYTPLYYMHMRYERTQQDVAKYIISLAFCVATYEFRGHRYVPTTRSNRTDAPWNPFRFRFFAH